MNKKTNDKSSMLCVYNCPWSLRMKLKRAALRRGITMSQYAIGILADALLKDFSPSEWAVMEKALKGQLEYDD
jgi:hypothetical protein